MAKTFLFIPTTFLTLLLAGSADFNFPLTSGEEPDSKEIIASNVDFNSDYHVSTIVIDAGHGGRDGGCSGANSLEKELNLTIAKKVQEIINNRLPELQVIMTRDKDVFIPLHKRAKIANENEADLFLSIHCNSIKNASHIHGSESYVLGLHRAGRNLEVVKRENDVIFMEEDYEKNYGFDPNSPAGHIMMSAFQNAHLEQSILFAEKIEAQIKVRTRHKSRGVKQAGFFVLRETTMPSVLLETGYLTNEKDEDFLITDKGQNQIANSVVTALIEYKNQVESGAPNNEPVRQFVKSKEIESPNKRLYNKRNLPFNEEFTAKGSERIENKKDSPTLLPKSKTSNSIRVVNEIPVAESPEVLYRVQIAASKVSLNIDEGRLKENQLPLRIIRESGYLKYQVGEYQSFRDSYKKLKITRQLGFPDSFIVAYNRDKKITLQKARVLTE